MLNEAEVIKLYRSGLGVPSVAAQCGCTDKEVDLILKKHRVSRRTKSEAALLRWGHVEALDPILILQEHKKGKAVSQIARELGYSANTVLRVLDRNNVKVREVRSSRKGKTRKKSVIKLAPPKPVSQPVPPKPIAQPATEVGSVSPQQIILDYMGGMSKTEITKKHAIGWKAVTEILLEGKVKIRTLSETQLLKCGHVEFPDEVQISQEYLTGCSVAQLVEVHGVSIRTIKRILARQGVQLR